MKTHSNLKRLFWRIITPLYPKVRNFLVRIGIVWHEKGRQRYHIGYLAPGKDIEGFKIYLREKGFVKNDIAWVDEGEIAGLRRIDENGAHQYHLRIFNDGEIRGHYEVAPEHAYLAHFLEDGMEARREEFLTFLGNWIMKTKHQQEPRAEAPPTPILSPNSTPRVAMFTPSRVAIQETPTPKLPQRRSAISRKEDIGLHR